MKTDQKIKDYSEIKKSICADKANGKKIVFTSGCYDLLHLGHMMHFDYCKNKGDILVVSVGSDKTIKFLKGNDRPINNEETRSRMVAAIQTVDYVVLSREFGKMDHNILIEIIKPDIYVVPIKDSHFNEKKRLIEKNGGKIIGCKRMPPRSAKGISTTELAKKIKIG